MKVLGDVCDKQCCQCLSHVLEDLQALDDSTERLEYLVSFAKELPCVKEEYKQECFKVRGCMSNLWLVPELKDGRCYFHCDGDAIIPKAVAYLLAACFSGFTPKEILEIDLAEVRKLGLEQFLSPNRRNALTHVPATIREYAKRFLADPASAPPIPESA